MIGKYELLKRGRDNMAITQAVVCDQARRCLDELFHVDRVGLNPILLLVIGVPML